MRKSRAKKRILMPDPKFGSVVVTRFINNLMLDGKKSIAFKVFGHSFSINLKFSGNLAITVAQIL